MLKKPTKDALSAAFWVFLLVGLALSAIPAGQKERTEKSQDTPAAEPQTHMLTLTWSEPAIFYAFWTAVFTGILAWSTIGLHTATKGLLRAAREADRPHMLETFKISDVRAAAAIPPAGNLAFTFKFRFTNQGKSPGWLKGADIRHYVGAALPPIPTYGSLYLGETVIAPGHSIGDHTAYSPLWPITVADRDALLAGSIRFFLYGRIDYEGTDRLTHVNRFCYEIKFGAKHAGDWLHPVSDPAYREYT